MRTGAEGALCILMGPSGEIKYEIMVRFQAMKFCFIVSHIKSGVHGSNLLLLHNPIPISEMDEESSKCLRDIYQLPLHTGNICSSLFGNSSHFKTWKENIIVIC